MAKRKAGQPTREWIDIPESLLSEVARLLDPRPREWGQERTGARRDVSTSVPRTLLESLIVYWSEDLGCDHGVGICMCDIGDMVKELRLALVGKMTCQACGGDGYLFDEDRILPKAQAMAAQTGEDVDMILAYDRESLGYYDCPACQRQGVTRSLGATA